MFCRYCGNQLKDGANFCPYCGKEKSRPKTSAPAADRAEVEFNSEEVLPEASASDSPDENAILLKLVKRIENGDQQAFEQLYNRTSGKVLYGTIRVYIKEADAADDVLQDTYIKVYNNIANLSSSANILGWIRTIAANTARDYLRKSKRFTEHEFSMDAENDDGDTIELEDDNLENLPEAQLDRRETARLMNEILDSLPEEQRLVLLMAYYENKKVDEIAAELGLSANTVKSRMNYGRKKVEGKVLELEKRGTKLYGLAAVPFLVFLLRSMDVQAAGRPDPVVLQRVLRSCGMKKTAAGAASKAAGETAAGTTAAGAAAGTTAAGSAATGAAAATAGGAAGGVAGGAAASGSGIAVKAVIAVLIASLAGGIGFAGHKVLSGSYRSEQEVTEETEKEEASEETEETEMEEAPEETEGSEDTAEAAEEDQAVVSYTNVHALYDGDGNLHDYVIDRPDDNGSYVQVFTEGEITQEFEIGQLMGYDVEVVLPESFEWSAYFVVTTYNIEREMEGNNVVREKRIDEDEAREYVYGLLISAKSVDEDGSVSSTEYTYNDSLKIESEKIRCCDSEGTLLFENIYEYTYGPGDGEQKSIAYTTEEVDGNITKNEIHGFYYDFKSVDIEKLPADITQEEILEILGQQW